MTRRYRPCINLTIQHPPVHVFVHLYRWWGWGELWWWWGGGRRCIRLPFIYCMWTLEFEGRVCWETHCCHLNPSVINYWDVVVCTCVNVYMRAHMRFPQETAKEPSTKPHKLQISQAQLTCSFVSYIRYKHGHLDRLFIYPYILSYLKWWSHVID